MKGGSHENRTHHRRRAFRHCFAGAAQGAFRGANGKIVFETNRNGNAGIYTMNADGTNRVNLTHNPAENVEPRWSPDGTRIAFASDRTGNFEIYTMNADGSNVRNLTNHPALDASPAWSPDGTKIAFVSDRSAKGPREIHVMNASGSHVVRITHSPAHVWSTRPDWQRR